jgi:hypothetical protein
MAATDPSRSAGIGSRIEVHEIGGTIKRDGEIIEVLGRPGHEHYRVRWTDGHESIHFPADGTRIFPKRSRRRAK